MLRKVRRYGLRGAILEFMRTRSGIERSWIRGEKDLLFSPFSDVYRRISLPTGVSLWNLFFDEIIAGCIVSPIDEEWK